MAEGFDKNLDKVTEREVVYDFIERLKFGKDSSVDFANHASTKLIYGEVTKLIDLIKVYNYFLPEKFQNLISYKGMNIDKSCVLKCDMRNYRKIELSGEYRLLYAYLDKLQFDITDTFDVDYNTSTKVTTIQAGFKRYNQTAENATNDSAGCAILFLFKNS